MVFIRTLAIGIAVWALSAPPARAAQPRSASLTGPSSRLGAPAFSSDGHAQKSSASSTTTTTSAEPEAPVPVATSDTPPPGRYSSPNRILRIADRLPKMRAVRAEYPGSFGDVYLKGPSRWQVSYFSKQGKEIGLVILADYSGHVLEQWTGFQIAWTMARGYPGAFGRHVNALYIWLPMCLLFFLPFFDFRRPFSLLHLDLLMLLSFSVSLAFFNHANIWASVPLSYPPRLLLLVPAPWLALGVVFLIGFRIALNVTDSNVIDVGYAGVIGASKIVHDQALYGNWPQDNEHGDTYGPVTYESYVPFEQAFGWSGTWDDLPAAHAAAIVFDLLALGLIFLLGLRIRGPTLGVVLAYAWVSYPFTLFALESNSNDTLVAVLILAALLVASSPPARGVFAALAGLAKFAPLALVPVLATHGLFIGTQAAQELAADRHAVDRRRRARVRARALAGFLLAFLLTVAIVSIPALTHDSLRTIFQRTLEYQAKRDSPFSVWGLYGGLHGVQIATQVAALALALALAVLPRRPDVIGLAAACAAIVIAVQLGVEHWFYLYIPWFFSLVMIALLGARTEPERRAPPHVPASAGRAAQTWAPAPDAPSGSARLRLPSAASWPSSG